MAEESRGTILLAGGVNLAVAVAKGVGGILSGSTAMLAESAHSVADTLNQVFLLTALRRSGKPADELHPFGYGMERYFWSLLAAVGIFVLGAGFSVLEGIEAILHPDEITHAVIVYVILGASFLLEGVSWLRAVRQLRAEAQELELGLLEHFRRSSDPTVKTVAFEDSAALVGILLAATGVTLHLVTGQGFWDGAASVAIGVLLVVTAFALGQENKSLLIGEALPADIQQGIREEITASAGVVQVVEMLTMQLGPDEVLVAARIDLDNQARGAAMERYADEVDERVRDRFPQVRHVFLDPTPAPASKDRPRGRGVRRSDR